MNLRIFEKSAPLWPQGWALAVLIWWLPGLVRDLNAQAATYTDMVKDVPFTMVRVEGGKYTMGSETPYSEDHADESPPIKVVLASYHIGETEVTQRLWKAVMGGNPSYAQCDECPVTNVSWEDVQIFLSELNRVTGKSYRLPTEAEWETAARGGQTGIGHPGTVDYYAWCRNNSNDTLHLVKQKIANGLYLHDMLGNVYEWCSDWYGPYGDPPPNAPDDADRPMMRICRGGGWNSTFYFCTETFRGHAVPGYRGKDLGFRLAAQ